SDQKRRHLPILAVILGVGWRKAVPRSGDSQSLHFVARKSPPRVIRRRRYRPYARCAMNLTHTPAIALGMVIICALAACGQPTQAQSETPAQIWHELAVCARAHGDPSFPDP